MRTARLGFLLSILALSCFLFACAETAPTVKQTAPAGKKTTIRIGSPFKSGSIVVDAAKKFKELVEKGSGGRIEVKIDAGTKAEIEINKLNRAGELEMQSNGTNFLEALRPPILLLHRSLCYERLRSLHACLERKARPGRAGPIGEERPEVPGDHLSGVAADDGEETTLHAGGCV